MAGADEPKGGRRAPTPSATAGAPKPRRRRWLVGVVTLAVVALAAWAMSSLILSGAEGGSAAVEQAQRAAARGLEDLEREAARNGQELDVNWTAVPDMSETNHLVTVRVSARPSGETNIGEFMVAGERVRPQGGFARQLVGEAEQQPR